MKLAATFLVSIEGVGLVVAFALMRWKLKRLVTEKEAR
ncbi:MAG: hypothetical protein QOE36_3831 [Gaiellaceae bacterium]|jgi:hypothetical protein|nr:hypothetical protein [Gaiellaceae bacterium]